ncbi:MAG TPA: VCBS repeat-containing protein [Mucilaginibacter sp.]
MKYRLIPSLLLLFVALAGCNKHGPVEGPPLFELLTGTQTGISFNNTVRDNKKLNIFNFRNFYNGGGVAIGDVNNDGKPDIFFTSNEGKNRLYLNRGNWKFEDVSEKAGITGINSWHTGVVMADVNGDGWLDIYVSNSGNFDGTKSANELYINQKDGTFKEMAHEYGLDDTGIGTQAVFFDYDHDGDLDCFILTNSFKPISSFAYDAGMRNARARNNGQKLYRNDNGHFVDVSEKAGIYGSEIGFGLGVTVGDLNDDGWPDIYVSNDFFEHDYLYINQHNGTFKEVVKSSMGHISLASMGSDMADINNDGHLDIFTTDMLPENDYRLKTTTKFDNYDVYNAKFQSDFHHQYEKNCLQLNNGDGTFSEIADLAGVEATDWSWGALSFDFNNDGWKDIFVSNGISRDLTDQDFLSFFGEESTKRGIMAGGFNYRNFIDRMPVTPIANYAFINQKDLTFKNRSEALGLATPSFSNGAAYGDLDGDGDLDLVVNNENQEAFVYRNMTSERHLANYLKVQLKGIPPNTFGIGSRVTIYTKGLKQMMEQMPARGFESSVEPVLNFGLGKNIAVDSLVIWWPNMKSQVIRSIKANSTLVLKQADAKMPVRLSPKVTHPIFTNVTSSVIRGDITHKENRYIDFDNERLIPKMLSTEGPKLAVADVNGDGLQDFFMGGAANDTAKLFIQQKDGTFKQSIQFAFEQDKDNEDVGAEFFDADNDGDMDLVVATGGNESHDASAYLTTRLYINDGKGNFTRSFKGWPMLNINASCVRCNDYDGDGNTDIFIGARSIPGIYGKSPASALLKNNGHGTFTDVTANVCPDLLHLGMVTDAQWVDIDHDGKKELVVVGDWMPVTIFKYQGGQLKKIRELPNSSGWWNSLTVADIDGNGTPDLIAGNKGLNSKIRADKDHPAKLYISDFGNNGREECIPVYYKTDGKAYPFNLYGDMMAEIPRLKKKFLKYKQYAGKGIEDLFTTDELEKAEVHTVNQSQTCVFYNNGKGDFTMVPLPVRAQFSPVFAALTMDLNTDNMTDIFLGGNFFGLKPEVGRYDASYGVSLLGSPGHGFTYMAPVQSGLYITGEVRDVKEINTSKGKYIIISRNNESLQIFKRTQ